MQIHSNFSNKFAVIRKKLQQLSKMNNKLENQVAFDGHPYLSTIDNKKKKFENLSPLDYNIYLAHGEDTIESNYYTSYCEMIDYVFEDPSIQNVCISGNFGTGKSSIIQSYFSGKNQKKFKPIFISLAHFSTLAGSQLGSQPELKNNSIDNILEMKIVNQLAHQINPKKIPKANIISKKNTHPFMSWIDALSILFFIIYLKYILPIMEDKITYTLYNFPPKIDALDLFLIGISITTLFLLVRFMYQSIQLINTGKLFAKFSVSTLGTTINLEQTDLTSISYFDHFLSDVIYMFDYSGAEVVIFEDLDRYSDHSIFEKLREINTIVNYKRKERKKNKIIFFYLIGDSVFLANTEKQEDMNEELHTDAPPLNTGKIKHQYPITEKTKFFDFIIPIVPVFNSSNAYEYLSTMLENNPPEFDTEFDDFLYEISLFIDDFRVLKNIVNEYNIYKRIHQIPHPDDTNQRNKKQLDSKKLLAIIVYKHIEMEDFNMLTKNSGRLFEELNQ